MGSQGEDILLSPAARRLLPISVECKARNKMALYGFYEQAKENAKGRGEPTVFVKQDRSRPLVIVDAEFFLDIMRKVSDE